MTRIGWGGEAVSKLSMSRYKLLGEEHVTYGGARKTDVTAHVGILGGPGYTLVEFYSCAPRRNITSSPGLSPATSCSIFPGSASFFPLLDPLNRSDGWVGVWFVWVGLTPSHSSSWRPSDPPWGSIPYWERSGGGWGDEKKDD